MLFINISPVHDHAESHCFMKIMKGTLRETKYKWPEQEIAPMEEKECTDYEENRVAYINSETKLRSSYETCFTANYTLYQRLTD